MRIFKASIVCGALAVSLATFLFTFGVFDALNARFWGDAAIAAPWTQWVAAAILGFGLAWSTIDIIPVSLKLVVAGVALVETAVLSWVLSLFGIVWPPFTPLASGVFALGFGLVYSFGAEGKRRAILETLFAERVSRETLRAMVDCDAPLPVTGERREASVVVCEVFNQAILAEELSVADYVRLTNGLLAVAAGALKDAGGVVESCSGERVRALFGLPLADAEHSRHACEAALCLGERLEAYCREAAQRWKAVPDYRIAVNSGEVIAAAYGAGAVMEFSVTGEALEFGRKLCLANTFYGSRILLGPRVFALASESLEVRPMELIRIQGQRAPEEIYELLAPKGGLNAEERERRDIFWKGIVLFREQRWEEAAGHFETVVYREGGEDAPARFYLERIAHAREGVRALDWDVIR